MQTPHDTSETPATIPAEDARQGEIVLRSKGRRAVFLAGLIIPLAILVILGVIALVHGIS
jgi:hypothetical protein